MGTDTTYHEIGPEADPDHFHHSEFEQGFYAVHKDVPRRYEYRIFRGSLYMRKLDLAGAGWMQMPFRHESPSSFLIRPFDFYQRMLPLTFEKLEEEGFGLALLAPVWIEEAGREGLAFSAKHRIPETLVDSADDATGFDPTSR